MHIHTIDATTIPDSWFQVIRECYLYGRTYEVTEGSYVGQKRRELEYVTVNIGHPQAKPLLPDMPPGKEHLNPISDGENQLSNYLEYIMTPIKQENETYTYGERLTGPIGDYPLKKAPSQLDTIIEKLKISQGTNQCCAAIAVPSDIHCSDPPCLRSIGFKVFDDRLHMFVQFRSWDLYNGYPMNLAGLACLQEYVAISVDGIECGAIVAASWGAHLYDHCFDFASQLIS